MTNEKQFVGRYILPDVTRLTRNEAEDLYERGEALYEQSYVYDENYKDAQTFVFEMGPDADLFNEQMRKNFNFTLNDLVKYNDRYSIMFLLNLLYVNAQMRISVPFPFTLSSMPLIDRVCAAKAYPGTDTNSPFRLCEC